MQNFIRKRPYTFVSIIFHLILFIFIIIFSLIKSCSSNKEYHVFELSDISENSSVSRKLEKNNFIEKKLKDNSNIREIESIEKIDYSDFLKKNPEITNKPIRISEKNEKVVIKKINFDDIPKFKFRNDSLSSSTESMVLDQEELNDYALYVSDTISLIWDSLDPKIDIYLEAEVRFIISYDGSIRDIKIIRSSKNDYFDSLVMNLMKSLERFSPTPNKKDLSYEMLFKLKLNDG